MNKPRTLSAVTAGRFAKEWIKSGSPYEAGRWAIVAVRIARAKLKRETEVRKGRKRVRSGDAQEKP